MKIILVDRDGFRKIYQSEYRPEFKILKHRDVQYIVNSMDDETTLDNIEYTTFAYIRTFRDEYDIETALYKEMP